MTQVARRDANIPKIVAMVMLLAPTLVMRVGVSYLRLRRGARRSGARLRSELLRLGMPPERAKTLSYAYESELKLTGILRQMRQLW